MQDLFKELGYWDNVVLQPISHTAIPLTSSKQLNPAPSA